jgi:hypothetical protein
MALSCLLGFDQVVEVLFAEQHLDAGSLAPVRVPDLEFHPELVVPDTDDDGPERVRVRRRLDTLDAVASSALR